MKETNFFKICGISVLILNYLLIFLAMGKECSGTPLKDVATGVDLSHTRIKPTLYLGRTKREITTTKTTDGSHYPSVTLSVPVDGDELLLDLELNKPPVPEDRNVFYQKDGILVKHELLNEELDLCHYSGSVRGKSNTWAAVSTCHGVNGVVFDGINMRHIDSNEGMSSDQENVYSPLDYNLRGVPENMELNSKVPLSAQKTNGSRIKRDIDAAPILGPYDANEQSRYVELVLVADHEVFTLYKGNISALQQHLIQATNLANAIFAPLNIYVALVGIVVWNERNEIQFDSRDGHTLGNFAEYKRDILMPLIDHDHAQFVTQHMYYGGMAILGGMCDRRSSVAMLQHSTHLLYMASVMAHEMGHTVGMFDDNELESRNWICKCPDDECLHTTSGMGKRRFSSCGLITHSNWLKAGKDTCMHNMPKATYQSPICGNGFTEPGEECDCGVVLPSAVADIIPCHLCCNPDTCKLRDNATTCNRTVLPVTYAIPGGVYPGRSIRVQASTSRQTQRSNINLQCGSSINRKDNIAFHLGVRFDQISMVRNHLQVSGDGTSAWGSEELEGGLPISRGDPFDVLFFCEENAFKVFINGEYFTEFKHRLPYQHITHLNFEEQITVRSVSFKDSSEVTPLTYPIPDGIYPGRKIRIQATTPMKAQRTYNITFGSIIQRFQINLQSGPSRYRKDNIAFHLGFRFDQNAVARNNLQISGGGSTWGSEEIDGVIPISRGEPFEVSILCEENAFKVFVNDAFFTEFKHRIPYQNITHLNFEDQITVRSVSFNNATQGPGEH